MHPRQLWLMLILWALVACAPLPVTTSPDLLQDIAPIRAQIDPHLLTLTERWATGGSSGNAQLGALFRSVLVDDPHAPLRLTYVISRLDVATVVSPTFYRARAYHARYQLTVQAESPAIGARQAWLQGAGESRGWVNAERAISDALTQAVHELCHQLAAVRDARASQGRGL